MAEKGWNLKISPFNVGEDHMATSELWLEWVDELELELRFLEITDPLKKKDAILLYGGKEIRKLEKSLSNPTSGDEYEKLKTKLTDYFSPKKNIYYNRYVFLNMKPLPDETTNAYAARLKEKTIGCEFHSDDERILEHLIQTSDNEELIRKVIYKKLDLSQTLAAMQLSEDTSRQVRAMSHSSDVAKIKRRGDSGRGQRYRKESHEQDIKCKYCDRHHPQQKEHCPAWGKTCRKCGKQNHFASVCISSTIPRRQGKGQSYSQRNTVRRTGDDQSSDDSGDDFQKPAFVECSLRHLNIGKININKVSDYDKTVPIAVNDVIVRMEPDTGADANVMDEHQYKALKSKIEGNIDLKRSNVRLSTLQNVLPVSGEFNAILRNENRGTETSVIVVKGRINSPPLISKKTLIELGMLEIRPDGSLKEENHLGIRRNFPVKAVRETQPEIAEIVKSFEDVFQGIGKIYDKKRDEEFFVKFSMKADAVPIAQKPRHVPYYLQEPLRKWLDECIREDIYEEVQPGEPITWCSPLVVQPKPRYTGVDKDSLEPNMIRASVDLRIPNKYMERNRILQAPVVEDFTAKFHGCKYFSKMDLRQGYHQLLLHPDSRSIATFSTPWGNMRPKRLIFGAKASQDLFDEAMFRIFGDIPYCLNQRDDILIGGTTLQDHNKTLKTVLQRAQDFGITLNKEKCQFGVRELEFFGYRFTDEGLKPTEDKVKAVKDCTAPESKEEVRSFLGMIGYLSKFIPRYAVLTEPLRRLTGKDVPFSWGPEEQVAFKKLKDSITNEDTMAFFNPKRPILVRTEASFHEGLSAGLFQKTGKGLQPVHYISRAMTSAEKRYSQTEKDALAVKWAKNRFSMYLLGAPKFKIMTSHKPLIPMFNRSCLKLPPRIEKWIMDMQDVDYELVYEPGKDAADPMDYLSRHPLGETDNDDTEQTIKMIVFNEYTLVMDEIKEEIAKDKTLTKIKEIMRNNDWERYKDQPEIKPYYMVRHELTRAKGLILRNKQIVIPEKLQKPAVISAHKMGHFGMTRTKQMLREKYWFPRLSSLVEDIISKCFQCQIATDEQKQEPVKPTEIPEMAWHTLSVDFGGPYPDGHYNLVVIDKRTRYPVVEQVKSTTFRSTADQLQRIFATYGVPKRIETDNGPPFNSYEFGKFAKEYGFYHHRVTPEHPRANGEAERFMKVINKTEKIARSERIPINTAVQDMLMGYRSTPHPATGYTPYEALMRRNVRTKLDYPGKMQIDISKMEKEITDKDRQYKKKWDDQHRHPKTKEHEFMVGEKVLLKKKKENKWSTAYEHEHYTVTEVDGSSIQAKRKSDGRTVYRDASKFKKFHENDEKWRERLLSIPEKMQRQQQNTNNQPDEHHNINPNDVPTVRDDTESGREAAEEPIPRLRPTRHQPRRLRRLPSRFKDFILNHRK